MKFAIRIIEAPTAKSQRREWEVEGREVAEDVISMADVSNVVEVESYLERILGHRVHITQMK